MRERVAIQVEEFIRAHFHVRPDDSHFTHQVNLWEEGYVDSTGAVEMIVFLEQTFAITLPEEVLFDLDFTHIEGISRLVTRVIEGRVAA